MKITPHFMETARQSISENAARFETAVGTALQYAVLANAGAILAILSFAGTVGKEVANVSVVAIPCVIFLAGIVAAGVAVYFNFDLRQKNFNESISSLILAVHHDDTTSFNDTHNGAGKVISRLKWSLLCAFVAFTLGILASAIVFTMLNWKADKAEKDTPIGYAIINTQPVELCTIKVPKYPYNCSPPPGDLSQFEK